MGLGGVLLPPPHPMQRQHNIAMSPNTALRKKFAKHLDDSVIRPHDNRGQTGPPPIM
jgi:hypothetical protein